MDLKTVLNEIHNIDRKKNFKNYLNEIFKMIRNLTIEINNDNNPESDVVNCYIISEDFEKKIKDIFNSVLDINNRLLEGSAESFNINGDDYDVLVNQNKECDRKIIADRDMEIYNNIKNIYEYRVLHNKLIATKPKIKKPPVRDLDISNYTSPSKIAMSKKPLAERTAALAKAPGNPLTMPGPSRRPSSVTGRDKVPPRQVRPDDPTVKARPLDVAKTLIPDAKERKANAPGLVPGYTANKPAIRRRPSSVTGRPADKKGQPPPKSGGGIRRKSKVRKSKSKARKSSRRRSRKLNSKKRN